MYKQDLALNNLLGLIYYKNLTNQPTNQPIYLSIYLFIRYVQKQALFIASVMIYYRQTAPLFF